ncbi:MAG: hypothetical protein ABJ327_16795 [Litoreibacter sp.]
MLPSLFKIAMFNHDGVGPFYVMDEVFEAPGRDWLIVERKGKILTVSDSNIPSEPKDIRTGGIAPFDLCENVSLSATHFGSSPDGDEACFLLSNFAPRATSIGGLFAPSCGIVRLRMREGYISLTAHGRETYDSAFDIEDGFTDPQIKTQMRMRTAPQRWSFSAQYRPWQFEQFPRHENQSANGR